MNPRRVLAVLALAELLAMGPWFSASAVAPALVAAWQLSPSTTAWLTISVQLGFVAGALVSATLTLADRFSARRLVAGSAMLAALAIDGATDLAHLRREDRRRLVRGLVEWPLPVIGSKTVEGWKNRSRSLMILPPQLPG